MLASKSHDNRNTSAVPSTTHTPLTPLLRMARVGCFAILAGLVAMVGNAEAALVAQTEQVGIRLLSSHKQVSPGGTLQIGIRQDIAPHWHTYWVNPGDSGMATQARWQLPAGWQASDIRWPVPKRFDIGPITNHGYEKTTTLLVDITVPANATIGQTIDAQVELSWLVCREVCIPQQAKLSVPITVARVPEIDVVNQTALQQAAQRLPQPPASPIEVLHTPKGLLIGLPEGSSSRSGVQFFADAWGVTQHNATQVRHAIGDRSWLLVPHGEDAKPAGGRLTGILKVGDAGLQVTADLKAAPAPWQTGLPWDKTEFKDQPAPRSTQAPFEWRAFAVALALAFLGGIAGTLYRQDHIGRTLLSARPFLALMPQVIRSLPDPAAQWQAFQTLSRLFNLRTSDFGMQSGLNTSYVENEEVTHDYYAQIKDCITALSPGRQADAVDHLHRAAVDGQAHAAVALDGFALRVHGAAVGAVAGFAQARVLDVVAQVGHAGHHQDAGDGHGDHQLDQRQAARGAALHQVSHTVPLVDQQVALVPLGWAVVARVPAWLTV